MTRKQAVAFDLPDQVLRDIRTALKSVRVELKEIREALRPLRHLECINFLAISYKLEQIARNTTKKRRRKATQA